MKGREAIPRPGHYIATDTSYHQVAVGFYRIADQRRMGDDERP
jgi:hypothetical protein